MGKRIALLFVVILTLSSLIALKSAPASAVPKPSVPEFTVSQVDRSYDVPVTTTYSTDPFTGQQITHRSGGYHVENKTIDVTIKNQPFTSTDLGNGSVIQLYYSVRAKGHFGDWSDASSTNGYTFKRVLASTSDYTVVTLIRSSEYMGWDIPDGGQEDFQVKAQAGYNYLYYGGHILPLGTEFETIEESSWSSTQTITIGQSDSTTTPNTSPPQDSTATPDQSNDQPQNSTPSSTEQPDSQNGTSFILDWEQLAILILVGLVILLAVWVLRLRKRNTKRT